METLWRKEMPPGRSVRMVSETFALAVSRCTRQQVTAPCGPRYRFLAAFRVVFFAVVFLAVFFFAVFFLAIKAPLRE